MVLVTPYVVRAVAQRLTELVRANDTVARVGGDEFVLLCGDITEQQALLLGHRIREAVSLPIDIGPTQVIIGVSVGLLSVPAAAKATAVPEFIELAGKVEHDHPLGLEAGDHGEPAPEALDRPARGWRSAHRQPRSHHRVEPRFSEYDRPGGRSHTRLSSLPSCGATSRARTGRRASRRSRGGRIRCPARASACRRRVGRTAASAG